MSSKVLIDALTEIAKGQHGELKGDFCARAKRIADEALRTWKEKEPTGLRWVKTSERLPEERKYYFVRIKNNRKDVYPWHSEENSANEWENYVVEWLDEKAEEPVGWTSLFNRMGEFAKNAFPGATYKDHINKLLKEAKELQNDASDPDEYADCLLCLIAAAYKVGISANDFLDNAFGKLKTCINREWIKQPDGTYQHKNLEAEEEPQGKEALKNKINQLELDENFNGHYHDGAQMMKEMILNIL